MKKSVNPMKFFICKGCGNIIVYEKKKGCNVKCCGEEMVELNANTADAAVEKHVPDVEINGNTVTVKVGSVAHPMVEAHYIEWVILETRHGYQKHEFAPGDAPDGQ